MDVSLILKIAGIGLLVAFGAQILQKAGRDEQAMLLTIAGAVIAMAVLVGEISDLVSSLRQAFGF